MTRTRCDVLVIGGGPAGATTALVLARAGVRVVVLERTRFPRLHVGESFLAWNFEIIRKLGLLPKLRELPHVCKLGAEFGLGNSLETTCFSFAIALDGGRNETFNIERACFDKMLLDCAREAGAEVIEEAPVRKILKLADGDVAVASDGQEFSARYLIDASGQGAVVGRHLGTRRVFAHHRKIACFGHFYNVKRRSGDAEGYPMIAMCDEGWFWLIPIDRERTSIGLVMDVDAAKRVDVPPSDLLAWGIAHCPLVADRTAQAAFPDSTYVIGDFSYTCRPYAGPGYFLVGDAAVFLDPIFSTGVCLGMAGAVEAATNLIEVLGGRMRPRTARRKYVKLVKTGSGVFFRLVELYYQHSFRELFLTGHGPFQVHRAIISLLAGHVFPRPRFALRWRMQAFEWIIRAQRRFPLAPNRERFSLMAEAARRAESAVSAKAAPSAAAAPVG